MPITLTGSKSIYVHTLCSLISNLRMQATNMAGRLKLVHIMINITRWLRTVKTLSLLPPSPPAPLFEDFSRFFPYNCECEKWQIGACWGSSWLLTC